MTAQITEEEEQVRDAASIKYSPWRTDGQKKEKGREEKGRGDIERWEFKKTAKRFHVVW